MEFKPPSKEIQTKMIDEAAQTICGLYRHGWTTPEIMNITKYIIALELAVNYSNESLDNVTKFTRSFGDACAKQTIVFRGIKPRQKTDREKTIEDWK